MSQQINLFNPAFKKQSKSFSLLTMLQALGVLTLGSLLLYGYEGYQGRQLDGHFDENARRLGAEQKRLDRLRAEFLPQQFGPALQNEVQQLEKRLGEQAGIIETLRLGGVGNVVGYSEYMRAFSRQVLQGLWLTGFHLSDGAVQISLTGAALDPGLLPAYIQRLAQEQVMRGKTFANLEMQQSKLDASAAAGAAPRYVEFKLFSIQDSEAGDAKAGEAAK